MVKLKAVETKKTKKTGNKILIGIYALVVLGLAGGGGYYYYRYNKVNKDYQKLKNTPATELITQQKNDEENKLISEVNERYNTPKDEKPTIAIVSDVDKLKGQSFFANAKNDDRVLAYQKAKIAILYRPSEKKIINVGPYNPVAAKINVALVGASADTAAAEQTINAKFPNDITVASKTDPKTTLTATIVVDINGSNADLAQKIANEVKGTVGSLPAGETKVDNAGIMVFVAPTQ